MKTSTTLALAIVGGGIFAYIWFVDRHKESTREAAETSAKVLALDQEKISSLSLKSAGGRIDLQKKDGVWLLESPVADRADADAVERVLNLLAGLRHDAKIELPKGAEAETLKEFGVFEADTALTLKSEKGRELEILLGKDSAVEGKIYLRQQGKNAVYVVRSDLRKRVTAPVDEYRDHRLSNSPVSSLRKCFIKTAEGEIALERKNTQWEVVRPLRARAASTKLNDLLANVLTARVHQFFPEPPLPEHGLGEPRATLTFHVEGEPHPLLLQVGAAPPGPEGKDRSYATISNRAAVTLLSNSDLDPLLKARPNDLRDRKLIRVEPDIVDRITIEAADQPALVLARKGEAWVQKEGNQEFPIKEGLAAQILSDLIAAEAVNFVADLSPDLEKFGLARPRLKIRLSSYASENTAETKAGERPLTTLLFGTVEGEGAYAKLEEEPFIIAAKRSLMDSLPTDASGLRPASPPERFLEVNPGEIFGIHIQAPARPEQRFERADTGWKTVSGPEKADSAAINALLERLAKTQGLKVPSGESGRKASADSVGFQIRLLSQKQGSQRETILRLGDALPDGKVPATVDGREGVFLLNAEDVSALERRLTE